MIRGKRIYIVGAGKFGRLIASEVNQNSVSGKLVAFLDDDSQKIGTKIDGIPVLGPIMECTGIIEGGYKSEALIAIPSASRTQLNRIHDALVQANFNLIKILPSVSQIISAEPHIVQAREMDPQDLLGREPILIDLKESLSYVRQKRVLITGAGGSIGSELSRQLLYGGAERLYLMGHGENSIWRITRELKSLQDAGIGKNAVIVPVIGELQDSSYVNFILNRLKADIVFHCAAHKHVPMMEMNPVEAVKNNVIGTNNLLQACQQANIERFVLISTDKAVDPVCYYGVSKRIAEMLVLSAQNDLQHNTVVRFGNVLGSRGSIMPLFKQQILSGGPVTVTHPDAKRWFITIPEAVSLVLKTTEVAESGGLYFLDMGEPIRIVDFAQQMIRFYGYSQNDIPIIFTGMRPGEKKTEKLYTIHEKPVSTDFERIMCIESPEVDFQNLNSFMENLKPIIYFDPVNPSSFRNRQKLKQLISNLFPVFKELQDEPEY